MAARKRASFNMSHGLVWLRHTSPCDILNELSDMFFKELHHTLPGILRGRCIVVATLIVKERVPGAWIEFDVVRDLVVIQFCVELLPM